LQRYYVASTRELVRINGTTKAPVMNFAAESILGVTTIRAFAATDRFVQRNLQLIDTDATLFFYTNAALEWVLLRVDAVFQVKYGPNAPTVLLGITCTFSAGNKIGVVGRTGSGKTTLLSALFRLIDPY
jgi:ABC-type multidrug transport system fused ATPase/permease subunit